MVRGRIAHIISELLLISRAWTVDIKKIDTITMDLTQIVFSCMVPTLIQGILFSLPILICGLSLRLLVRLRTNMNNNFVNVLASLMGLLVLWWYYGEGVLYFVILCGMVYCELILLGRHRGAIIGFTSVVFLLVW